MDKEIDLLESVKLARAEIERIQKENVNINQFFPSMAHNFEKYSSGKNNYWPELASSVTDGKSKKGKGRMFNKYKKFYKNTKQNKEKKKQKKKKQEEDEEEEKEEEKEEEDEEEEDEEEEDKEEQQEEEARNMKHSLNDTTLQMFSDDNKESENVPLFTSLQKAVTHNFDEDGFFLEAADVDSYTKSKYLIHCESIFDSLVWVSKTCVTDDFDLERNCLIKSSITKDLISAMHYKSVKNYSECLKSLYKVFSIDFNNPFCLADRAEIYIILGDIQSAVQNYSRAVFLYENSPVFKFRLANLYCFQGQIFQDLEMYREALKAFRDASKWDPEQLIYKAKSFSCLVKMKCIPQAWVTLNTLIQQNPDNSDLIVVKARLRHLIGEYTLAYYDLENIVEKKDNTTACAMLEAIKEKAEEFRQAAIKLNMQQHFHPAIKNINLAIKLRPTQARFYFLRGVLYRHINEFTLAIDDLIEALQKSDSNEKKMFASDAEKQLLLTFNDFSVECFKSGYLDDAIQLLNKAISVEKMQKGLYLNRAECFYQKEDYHFALQDYEQALELDPLDRKYFPRISELCYILALQCYTNRDFEESVMKLNKAASYSPTSGRLYILRAKCKHMLQNLYGARQDILLSFHLMPTSKNILPVFAYLFPSIPTKNILTSTLATQSRIMAEQLLSDPEFNKTRERMPSFTAGESSVLTSIVTDPLTVSGNQTPTLLQSTSCSTPDLLQEKKKISTKIKHVQTNKEPLQTSEHKLATMSNAPMWEAALSKPETNSKNESFKIPSSKNGEAKIANEMAAETWEGVYY